MLQSQIPSGATGTIVTADIATGTTAVDVISTDAGSYDALIVYLVKI